MRYGAYYFGAGEDGGTPDPTAPSYDPYAPAQTGWSFQPGWDTGVSDSGIPYYLEKPKEEEQPPFIGPEYRPELLAKPLPSWVIPAAIGAGAFVLLGGMGLLLGRKRRR